MDSGLRWRRASLVLGVALFSGILVSSCANSTGAPCKQGTSGCVCVPSNGSVTCGIGECPAERTCGDICCGVDQHCDNNACESNAAQCLYVPGPDEFEAPEVAWWWPYTDPEGKHRQKIELPAFDQVMSTPAVVRLRGAAHPEDPPSVIFSSFVDGGSPNVEGVLRIARGDTGETILSVTDPALRVNGVSSVAVGDLDGDGFVEIVTGAFDTRPGSTMGGLIAFRYDGTLYWRSPDLFVGWGGVAIADLDADGKPEVVVGNTVVNGQTGKVRCDGGWTGIGDNGAGPLSVVADIDGDGKLEIITGDMAYQLKTDGNGNDSCIRMWPTTIRTKHGSQLYQGFSAVGDLLDDPSIRTSVNAPEVAVVSDGMVRVQDWTGGILLDPLPIPGGGFGGPPTIADFDGDGKAELGVAGQSSYTVYKLGLSGSVLWTVKTQDVSSSTTGSSVFDFDGNGTAEVIYNDECFVHVYNGTNGDTVFEAPNSSCTAYEMPVIADVDGTGAAGLLVPSNNMCNINCPWGSHRGSGFKGLRLFRSPSDTWVASRPVWNQHSFHMTNVGDNGEIPTHEPRFWGPDTLNSFRQNYQGEGKFAAPDLAVTRTRLDGTQCPTSLQMVAEVSNLGSRGVRAGLDVAFYEDTGTDLKLLGVVKLPKQLQPGDKTEVSLEWKGPPRINAAKVVAVADDDGTKVTHHKECNETNNTATFAEVICRNPG